MSNPVEERPARKIYKLDELAALQDTGDRWIIPGVLQTGSRAILYGHGGVGKSNVIMDLSVAVASGTPFLGEMMPAKQGPVLVCSTEGDIFANRDRLLWLTNAHDVPLDIPLYFMQDAMLLDDNRDREEFWKIIAAYRPVLLILDPLDSFFWGEENSASATKPVRHFINSVIQEFRTCVVVLHHAASKSEEPGQLRKPRGSSAWHGWADTVIRAQVERRRGERSTLTLEVEKQRNARPAEPIRVVPRIDPERSLIVFEPGDVEPHGMVAARIVDLLRAETPLTFTAIRERVGGRTATIRAALRDLEDRQVVSPLRILVPAGYGRHRHADAWQLMAARTRHMIQVVDYSASPPPNGEPAATSVD